MYTEFAIEILGFNRHLTDTLRYHHTRCSRDSGLLAAITQHVYHAEEMWSLLEVLCCFSQVLKVMIAGPSSNSSIGMENNDELYGFSTVKVKLVDSLI